MPIHHTRIRGVELGLRGPKDCAQKGLHLAAPLLESRAGTAQTPSRESED